MLRVGGSRLALREYASAIAGFRSPIEKEAALKFEAGLKRSVPLGMRDQDA